MLLTPKVRNMRAALGIYLRRHRLEKRRTQEEMARKLGFTSSYYQRLEHGNAGVHGPQVVPLLRRFGVKKTAAEALARKWRAA